MADVDWILFDEGSNLGLEGSEAGIVVRDEAWPHFARITIERNTRTAPFAITCGIYGWMIHTRFFKTESDASSEFERMKAAMGDIILSMLDANEAEDRLKMNAVTKAIRNFVEEYP